MKYCGKERGSITLFLALILSLLLSLVCTSIESVRMASGRRRCRCCGDHADSCSPDRACHYFQRAADRTGAEHSFKDRQTE